jgi:hypothetical protein
LELLWILYTNLEEALSRHIRLLEDLPQLHTMLGVSQDPFDVVHPQKR